jgi:D-3-phosphoglycerate dehydrogenase
MTPHGLVVVLDSLLEDLGTESRVAEGRGWSLEQWGGGDEQLSRADIVLHVRTTLDAAMFERLARCRVIGRFGTGLDTVDAGLAESRKIALVNVRDYCIPELSAHTLGLIFALTRAICSADDATLSAGSWQSGVLDRRLSPIETIGVVGLGSVGRTVSGALSALGLSVLAVSGKSPEAVAALGATKVDLGQLLARADVVSLHLPLLPETTGMIGAPELERMRDGTVLVNTARLGLLDENAVAEAVVTGRLRGLGLDARLAADSPIARVRDGRNVIVTPHVGWYSGRSASVLRREAVSRSIDAFEQLVGTNER